MSKYITEDELESYLKSEQFKINFVRQVEKDTWEKGLPKIYMDDKGNIIEHYKNGTIKILKTKEELNEKRN